MKNYLGGCRHEVSVQAPSLVPLRVLTPGAMTDSPLTDGLCAKSVPGTGSWSRQANEDLKFPQSLV